LKQLDAMDQIDLLQNVVATFTAKQGHAPAAWADLVRAGYLRGTIVDPTGAPYRLDGSTVSLDPKSRLLPLPKEGARP